jgi:hypothetical protein
MVARAMMTRMARRRRRGSAGRFTLINISSVCKPGKPLGRTTPPLPVLACASRTLRRGVAWFADQSCVLRSPRRLRSGCSRPAFHFESGAPFTQDIQSRYTSLSRSASLRSALRYPHRRHRWLEGKMGSTASSRHPVHAPLYRSWRRK